MELMFSRWVCLFRKLSVLPLPTINRKYSFFRTCRFPRSRVDVQFFRLIIHMGERNMLDSLSSIILYRILYSNILLNNIHPNIVKHKHKVDDEKQLDNLIYIFYIILNIYKVTRRPGLCGTVPNLNYLSRNENCPGLDK